MRRWCVTEIMTYRGCVEKTSAEIVDWTAVCVREMRWWVEIGSHARDAPDLRYERKVSILMNSVNQPGRSERFSH